MSNAPLSEGELPASDDLRTEEEPSWLERLLARFGLGEEPDLREVIEDTLARGKAGDDTFSAQERAMLLNILRFGKLTVEDVMVPRADIIAVEESITVADLMAVFREAEHSRLPVYRETLDDPRGMIHIRDLMSWITTAAEKSGEVRLDLGAVDLSSTAGAINITREILYVPPSMPVLDLLLRMQLSRRHLALVVDEYGGTDGLVSIEDLVEEVVGEIEDEHDVAEEAMIRQDPKLGLIADARTPIEDLARHLGVELATPEQEEDIDTIGGLVFSLAGRIPARGELGRHLRTRLCPAACLAGAVLELRPVRLAARRLPRKAWHAAPLCHAYRILVRLRLFPHRSLLDRRSLSGRALAARLAHPLRHDGARRRHGSVLCRRCGACRNPVAPRRGKGFRGGNCLRPRRVRPRPRADRAALEPRGIRARRNPSHDAGSIDLRRLRA